MLWNKSLVIGVVEMDAQHQELFHRVDRLLQACQYGKGLEEVTSTLQFLDEYVVSHFAQEEALMKQHKFPGHVAHVNEHVQFKKDFAALKVQLKTQGCDTTFVVRANELLVDWLYKHIAKEDRKYAAFLKTA